MNIFLHICCGPCSIYPLTQLRAQGIEVQGYFYNPNIHPYREFKQRIQGDYTWCQKRFISIWC